MLALGPFIATTLHPQMYGTLMVALPPDMPRGALPPFVPPLLAAYAGHLHGDIPQLLADVLEVMEGDREAAAGQCVPPVLEASHPVFAAGAGGCLVAVCMVFTA